MQEIVRADLSVCRADTISFFFFSFFFTSFFIFSIVSNFSVVSVSVSAGLTLIELARERGKWRVEALLAGRKRQSTAEPQRRRSVAFSSSPLSALFLFFLSFPLCLLLLLLVHSSFAS